MVVSLRENNYATIDVGAEGIVNLAPATGKPALPQVSRLLVLPRGAELRIGGCQKFGEISERLPSGRVLAPWQGASVKDAEPMSTEPDKETYATDSFFRWGNPVEVEELGIMGDRQMFRITVHPMAYNPATGTVVAYQHISASLQTSGVQQQASDHRHSCRYLIVSRTQFRDGLQPFVRWKRQEGYVVEEIYADTNKRDIVKAMIAASFGDGLSTPWPCYMLIVGDAAMIQAYTGTSRPAGLGTHPTDLEYANHTGDYLPDVMFGRWPVNDTAELRAVVEKTLRYERGSDMDTSALRRVLLVAGKESQTPAPVTTNGQVNYLKREMKRALPSIDTLCYHNPASSNQLGQILSDIGSGIGLLNYTAHCSTAGWSNPELTFTGIDTIGTHHPTVIVNNCCQSNNFTGTCFGEQLLRKPRGGGVAVIGATNSTLWNEDYYWAVGPKYPFSLDPLYDSLHPGAFDPWLGGGIHTVGQLLFSGNLAVSAFGSPYDRFYWEIYCLFGDPSLVPWIGVAQTVQLSAPDAIAVGAMELHVSGTPGATVSAMQGDELLGVVLLDGQQGSLLRLHRPVDTMPVLLTATMPRMLPVELSVPSAMPQGKAVTFLNAAFDTGGIGFTLVNIGTDTIYGVNVALTEADSGTMYASFTAPTAMFDTLPPQASHTMHLSLHLERWAPMLAASLVATDSDGDSWRLTLGRTLDDAWPDMAFGIHNADTSFASVLQQGGNYLVEAVPSGLYDTLAVTATTLPDNTAYEGHGGWLPVVIGAESTHLRLKGYIAHGNYSREYEYYLVVGDAHDGFGNGLAAYPWQTGGSLPWVVDSTANHTGRYSMRSGAIDSRQTSNLSILLDIPAPDSVSFWMRSSSELNYDKASFIIDGVKVFELSGENNWYRYAFLLPAGQHTLIWRYSKDETTSSGSDCVWLDDVRLPMTLWGAPYGAQSDDGMMSVGEPTTADIPLRLFPNPSNGHVTVDADGTEVGSIRMSDLYGRTAFTADLHNTKTPLTFNLPLPDGIYFVELRTKGGTTHSKLIIIR